MHRLTFGCLLILTFFFQIANTQSQKSTLIYDRVIEMQEEFPEVADQVFKENKSISIPSDADKYVSKAEYFLIEDSYIQEIKAKRPNTIFLEIPFEGKKLYVQLYQKEVTTPVYKVKSASGASTEVTKSIFYRGIIQGNSNSLVSLSLTNSGLRMTLTDGNGNFEINKISKELYAVYRVADSKYEQDSNCSTDTDQLLDNSGIINENKGSSTGDCIEVYIECDYDSFTKNGFSIQNTEDWALSLMNEVGILYENVGVPMAVSDILVYDLPDPYQAGGDSGDVLGMMGGVIGNNYNGRLAHVFSTRSLGGGVAYVNVLCQVNNGGSYGPYAVSGNMNSSTIPFPIYSWNVMVVAHELGHNIGSLHTHNCVWNGNNTQIDDCGNEATDQGNSSACYDENNPILPDAGSIMSYCHLIWTIGIDFNVGFGTQPGALLLNKYLNASCVTGENCAGGAPPVADFTYTQYDLCNPAEVLFTDISTNNPTTFMWDFPGGNPSFSTEQNPLVTYPDPGTFDVTLTVSNFAGEDVLILNQIVTISETPSLAFDTEIENDTMKFMNQTTGSVISYFWEFGDANTSTEENPCHAYEQDGSYPVTLSVLSICGEYEIEEYVDFFTPPSAAFEADTTLGCSPLVVNFINQSSENTDDYNWTFEGGNPQSSTEENPSVEYDSAGVYSVTLVVSNEIGEDSLIMSEYVTIEETPTADFEYSADSLEIMFSNNSMSYDTLMWDFGDGDSSTMINPIHVYEEEGTYDVSLIVSNMCDTITTLQTLVLISPPTANYSASGTEGCLPFTVEFTNNSSLNTDSLKWSFPGGTPEISTEENPSVVYNEVGIYDVMLVVMNPIGSDTLLASNYISVGDIPTAEFNFSVDDLEVEFMDSSTGYDSIQWDFGDGNISMQTNPVHSYVLDGSYEVILTTTNECGSNTNMQTVLVSSLPTAGFSGNNQEDCIPFAVVFSNNSSNNANEFDWSFPGGTPSSSTEENPTISYETSGIFDVSLIVTSAAGKDTLMMNDYVTSLDVPISDFEYSALSEFEYSFTNTSVDAESFLWRFGDGMSSTLENPSHIYEQPGIYEVILDATNECGQETHIEEITITDPTSVIEITTINELKVYPNPNKGVFTLSLNSSESGIAEMEIYNTLGQQVLNKEFQIVSGSNEKSIQMQNSVTGVYLMLIRFKNERKFIKVVVD